MPRWRDYTYDVLIQGYHSQNFLYRNLNPDHESLEDYHSWLTNVENKFIESVQSDLTTQQLKEYVMQKNHASDAILIGVFDLKEKEHIGNVKFEPIDFLQSKAWMGILIGSFKVRGKGFSNEIIESSCLFLAKTYGIQELFLGVDPLNVAALKAYGNSGFREVGNHSKGGLIMVRDLF